MHPNIIRAKIFPYDDGLTGEKIQETIQKFVEAGKLAEYRDDKDRVIYQLVNWWRYQSPQWPQPSKYPPPPGWTDRIRYHGPGREIITQNWSSPGGYSLGSALPSAIPKALPYTIEYEEEDVESRVEEEIATTRSYLTDGQAHEIYRTVVQTVFVPYQQADEIANAIRAIWNQKRDGTVEYLKPFFEAAKARYGKNGRLFWLTEWAANGEIPLAKGEKPRQKKLSASEELEEARKRLGA